MCAAAWIFGLQPVNFCTTLRYKVAWRSQQGMIQIHWTIPHSGSTKTYIISNDFKADKLSSEVWILGTGNNLEIWAETCERARLELPEMLSHSLPHIPPREADLGPHTAAVVVVVAKVHFWLSTSHGLSQNILLHPLKALEHLVNTWSSFPWWRSRKCYK